MGLNAIDIIKAERDRAEKLHADKNTDFTEGYLDAIDYAWYILFSNQDRDIE